MRRKGRVVFAYPGVRRARAVVGVVGAGGWSQASRWGLVVCSSAAGCGGFSRDRRGRLPTCRLSGLSICWEVGKLESWRGGPEEAREVRVGG